MTFQVELQAWLEVIAWPREEGRGWAGQPLGTKADLSPCEPPGQRSSVSSRPRDGSRLLLRSSVSSSPALNNTD